MSKWFKQEHFTSFDGTRIGYQTAGSGPTPLILCNGLGGTMIAWKPFFDAFKKDYTLITWDYRGLFESDIPQNLDTLSIPHHVMDLKALLDHLNLKKVILGGWSMGVQVALEFHRNHSKQIKGLILINGTSGMPFDTALNSPLSKYIIPIVNDLLKKHVGKVQPALQPLTNTILDRDEFLNAIQKLGLIHRNLNTEIFKDVAQGMMNTNLTIYHHIMEYLSKHDATDQLEKIKAPTLIVTGTKDLMTPHSTAEKMAHLIKKSQLFQVNEGSHYCLIEFPELIITRVRAFLNELN